MQERVSPQGSDFADILVQYNEHDMTVGVGLEMNTDRPNHHLIDQIYWGAPVQTEIGRAFWNAAVEDEGLLGKPHQEFVTSDEEAEYYNRLGRMILDAVTGSRPFNGAWTTLDRPGVQHLIRLLRKARDQAFGRDE